MFGLPQSTEVNQKISKKTFYENAMISSSLKRFFIDEVESVWWRNKISSASDGQAGTVPLAKGNLVEEIQIIEVVLKSDTVTDSEFLVQIDKYIPYHIVFVLTSNSISKIALCYKDIEKNAGSFKIKNQSNFFYSKWDEIGKVQIFLKGVTLDDAYENIFRFVVPDLPQRIDNESLLNNIRRYTDILKIEKECQQLRKKEKKELQTNRKVEIKEKIVQLINKIKDLKK